MPARLYPGSTAKHLVGTSGLELLTTCLQSINSLFAKHCYTLLRTAVSAASASFMQRCSLLPVVIGNDPH
jgi:hypothetical protein